jgi:TolB protein
MKNKTANLIQIVLPIFLALVTLNVCRAQDEINISTTVNVMGQTKPIPVSLEGFTGAAADVLKFDLYVQGFSLVAPEAAQYRISGSSVGNVEGQVTDAISRQSKLSPRSYTSASLRRQAHAFADDIVLAITGKKGIGQTKIAFKAQSENGAGEIYVSDFDGHNAQAVTRDNAIVAAPAWSPGLLALYYTSYQPGNPDIFYHNLSTGERRIIAKFSGLNTSAAVSPDGKRLAMILSKSGSPNVWVCNADGTDFRQLTFSPEDESSPCWSPDGQWICFATKIHERRVLAKVPAGGGEVQRIPTSGVSNPTDPDWSPDGKWIAFTSQMGDFSICVVPAGGGTATVLVSGQHPSWAPNSRTLVLNRDTGYRQTLSVLDVMTKQVKDIGRISGNDSQPAWAKQF